MEVQGKRIVLQQQRNVIEDINNSVNDFSSGHARCPLNRANLVDINNDITCAAFTMVAIKYLLQSTLQLLQNGMFCIQFVHEFINLTREGSIAK